MFFSGTYPVMYCASKSSSTTLGKLVFACELQCCPGQLKCSLASQALIKVASLSHALADCAAKQRIGAPPAAAEPL